MEQYLIDTNVVSKYLTGDYSLESLKFLDPIVDQTINISIITHIELLSWKTDKNVELVVKDLTRDSNIIDLSPAIVEICISIRRTKNIKTPDALIAATALANNLTLITGNEKDFQNIKGLTIINPHKL